MFRTAFFSIAVALIATSSFAQAPDRGYVQGMGGVAATSATDGVFAAAVAVRASSRLHVFGELGHLRNGIWTSLDDELAATGEAITNQITALFGNGTTATFEAKVPTWYGLGGARVLGPRLGAVETYLEGGIGFARLRPEVQFEIGEERLDAEAERLLSLESERSELMSAAGAGIAFRVAGPIRVEAGYRFSRLHGDEPFNVNRVHAGLGFAF